MWTYLNDHLTDETLAVGLAERVAAANKGTPQRELLGRRRLDVAPGALG